MYIFSFICQSAYYILKEQFKLLITFSPIFVEDTKIIFGYNFFNTIFFNTQVQLFSKLTKLFCLQRDMTK